MRRSPGVIERTPRGRLIPDTIVLEPGKVNTRVQYDWPLACYFFCHLLEDEREHVLEVPGDARLARLDGERVK